MRRDAPLNVFSVEWCVLTHLTSLTTLAQGVQAEQYDLTNDELTEAKNTALLFSPLDDAVINAWAGREAAQATVDAWNHYSSTQAAPVADFAYSYPGGAAPMSGINHAFDLASNDDEVAMAAAVAATGYPHWFWVDYLSRVTSWNPPQPAVDGLDSVLTGARKTAVVTAGVATVAAGGALSQLASVA